jgi:hypothetical protein
MVGGFYSFHIARQPGFWFIMKDQAATGGISGSAQQTGGINAQRRVDASNSCGGILRNAGIVGEPRRR